MMQNKPWIIGLFVLVAGLFVLNFFLQSQITNRMNVVTGNSSLVPLGSSVGSSNTAVVSNDRVAQLTAQLIPTGVPAVYGSELSISFDEPEAALNVLAGLDKDMASMYDPMLQRGQITQEQYNRAVAPYANGIAVASLSAELKQRYIQIGTAISCEYCCGSKAMVRPQDGLPACGCAHSAAMRGLAKSLLVNHADLSNAQILDMVKQVKALSFPRQTVEAALRAEGGAVTGTPSGSATGNLPNQVGGC